MKNTIHVQGYIKEKEEGEICFLNDSRTIADTISYEIINQEYSKHQPKDDHASYSSNYIQNAALRMYFSESEMPLDHVKEKVALSLIGALDIYTEWYGYSEYTIEGYNVVNFTIGAHDLEKVLRSYLGKYVHIVIEY